MSQYYFCETKDCPMLVEKLYKEYIDVLHGFSDRVPLVTSDREIHKYKNSCILYNDNSFCIIFFDCNYYGTQAEVFIQEFYALGCGKKLLKELKAILKLRYRNLKDISIILEIIDTNERAKKFWNKNLKLQHELVKRDSWLTPYLYKL